MSAERFNVLPLVHERKKLVFQMQLYANGSIFFRTELHTGLEDSIAEAKVQMRRFGATGGKLVLVEDLEKVVWEAGFCPEP